jgi:hypothetical protein
MKKHRVFVSDREADASLQTLVTGPVVRAAGVFMSEDSVDSSSTKTPGSTHADSFPPSALRLLRAVVEHPLRRSSEYPKLAGMSPNTAAKARSILAEEALMREQKLESHARGRAAILLEPLEAGKALIAELGGTSS